MNVLIYADENETLWSYRNMLYDIREKKTYRMEITLTKSLATFFNVASFLQGGVDLLYYMAPAGLKALDRLQSMAREQESVLLVVYGAGELFWGYYQEGSKKRSGRLSVNCAQDLRNMTENLCDRLAETKRTVLKQLKCREDGHGLQDKCKHNINRH